MKIALCTEQDKKDAMISEHFGRCEFFAIYDLKTLSFSFIHNPFIKENGAGGKAAKLLHQNNIDVVVIKEIGDKAHQALRVFNIACAKAEADKSIIDNVYLYFEKKLAICDRATKENKQKHTHHESHDHLS